MNGRNASVVGGILGGVGVGAGLMYFLDPGRGRRRRAQVRDKAVASVHTLERSAGALAGAMRDGRNRGYGLYAEARKRLRSEEVTDDLLEARIRSRMGHHVEHPDRIDVSAEDGRVTVRGQVRNDDAAALRACVAGVKGVKEVVDLVEVV